MPVIRRLRLLQPDVRELLDNGVIIDSEDEIISVDWNMTKPRILLLTRKTPKDWSRGGGLTG